MFSEDKLEAVRNYLKAEFPNHEIADQYDFSRYAQTFRLAKENDRRILLITVAREFLDDHVASEISEMLKRSKISRYSENERVTRIIVTNSGIKVEN